MNTKIKTETKSSMQHNILRFVIILNSNTNPYLIHQFHQIKGQWKTKKNSKNLNNKMYNEHAISTN